VKKDDCHLSTSQQDFVQRHAHLLLKKAGAYDRFPTPVADIVKAAKLELDRDNRLDSSFLGRVYKTIREPVRWGEFQVKKALDKVQGLLWREERRILLDPDLYPSKRTFITLHEVGHEFLPDQRSTFAMLEDSESELDPETKDLFERQASVFASDVLFQLDRFDKDAFDCNIGMATPLSLSKRYGASVYASARRYVQRHHQPCALVVYNQPIHEVGIGATMELRRSFQSPSFFSRFGEQRWPKKSASGDFFVDNIPRKKLSRPIACVLTNLNGVDDDCRVEVFDSTYQVFFLIYPIGVADDVRGRAFSGRRSRH